MKFKGYLLFILTTICPVLLSANTNWLCEAHDPEGTHFQDDEDVITKENADKFFLKWYKGSSAVLASPTVYGNKVFYGDALGAMRCVYAEDGAEVWNSPIGTRNIFASPTVVDDNIFSTCPISSPTSQKEISHMISVKRKSGKLNWKAMPKEAIPFPNSSIRLP